MSGLNEATITAFRRDLRQRLPEVVRDDRGSLGLYATDASLYQIPPVAVVSPRSVDEVMTAIACAWDHGVPIVPRGGGTGLAGQAIGRGLVIDLSGHLNRLTNFDPGSRRAVVEPGLVRDNLNAALAPSRLQFAPDPATSNRCNVGGMIANNSSGTRSLVYGNTSDHVVRCQVALADGQVIDMGPLSEADPRPLVASFRQLIEQYREPILERYPQVMRRVAGYSLDHFAQPAPHNLAQLFCGSEGTLGVLLSAEINLEPLPTANAVCALCFTDRLGAIRQVTRLLELEPAAIELIDRQIVSEARRNLDTAAQAAWIPGDPEAVLLVEFFADSPAEAAARARQAAALGMGYAQVLLLDKRGIDDATNVRKKGLGLLLAMRQRAKPLTFIEDACVPPAHLAEYVEAIVALCEAHQTPVILYGHASVGVLHIRPILDAREPVDLGRMTAIAEASCDLVRQFGGSLSGEHGDGLVRSPLLERFYGPEVTAALGATKRLFDPRGLMNPHKIVDPPARLDQDLRYGPDYPRAITLPTWFHYRADGGFDAAVEMCNGVGACRKTLTGTMCPSYQATLEEEHSTRGRANALRLAMTGWLDGQGLASARLAEVLDLCLSCKGCKAECPSNVDVARLKSEVLQHRREAVGWTLRDRLICASADLARLTAGPAAPLLNRLQASGPARWLLERAAGFDARRTPPALAARRFTARRPPRRAGDARRPPVVLFADTYLDCHEPGLGEAAWRLLVDCGYAVTVDHPGCCQRPRLSHGDLRGAKRLGERTLRGLDRWLSAGVPVVVVEPGCASALTDDLPDLIDDAELGRRAAAGIKMIDVFLAEELAAGRLRADFRSPYQRLVLHGHCHQKALYGTASMRAVWATIADLTVTELDSGCCGMAGSFGYEAEHYDLSQRVGEDRLFPALRSEFGDPIEVPEGAAVVACGFSCRHQLADRGIPAVHWVQTLTATGRRR